jgi:hypothetical protein
MLLQHWAKCTIQSLKLQKFLVRSVFLFIIIIIIIKRRLWLPQLIPDCPIGQIRILSISFEINSIHFML